MGWETCTGIMRDTRKLNVHGEDELVSLRETRTSECRKGSHASDYGLSNRSGAVVLDPNADVRNCRCESRQQTVLR